MVIVGLSVGTPCHHRRLKAENDEAARRRGRNARPTITQAKRGQLARSPGSASAMTVHLSLRGRRHRGLP